MVNGVVVEKESEMNLIILTELILLVFLQTGKCMWYLKYFDEPKSWTDAKDQCRSLNGSIFTVDRDYDTEIQHCSFYNNISSPLWTGRIKSLSDWIEMNFCYKSDELEFSKQLMFKDLNGPYACQYHCLDTQQFAYHKEGNIGICLCVTAVKVDAPQHPLCEGQRKYRLYTNQILVANIEDCSTRDCKCMYTINRGSVRHFILSSCQVQRTAKCGNNNSKNNLTWHEAKDFCEADQKSLLLQRNFLIRDMDIWTGIFKEYTFVWYEKIKYTVVPINCSVSIFYQSSYIERDCEMKYPFVCKTDIPLKDANQHNCIFSTTTSHTENITMSATFDTLNVSSMKTTDSGITESAEGISRSSTDIVASTFSVAENVTNTSDQKTEGQNLDIEYIGASVGTFVVLLVVGIVVVLARRQCSEHDNLQNTKISKVKTTKTTKCSTSSDGNSNVIDTQAHMYCDLLTPIEETYDALKAANKANRESNCHIYE